MLRTRLQTHYRRWRLLNNQNLLLQTLRRFLPVIESDEALPTPHDMYRAAHTLAGISATVGLLPINRLGYALEHALQRRDLPALFDWQRRAPHAARAHPSPEHLLPLYVALGAAGDAAGAKLVFSDYQLGALSLDAFFFPSSPA